MKINICNIGNKEWLDFKADISFGMFYSLLDLGYDVTMSINDFSNDRLNIVIGAESLVNNSENIRNILDSKIEYVLYEIENFDGFSINGREDFNAEGYKLLIERAIFVITPYLSNVKFYSNLCDADKIRYARWGFHENMIDQRILRSRAFEFDALYFGMLKGDRAVKIQTLINNQKCKVKLLGRNDPLLFKDYFVSCCRWGLNLSCGDSEKFINPFRLYYMVANGMPVLADGGCDDDDYLAICEVIDFSHFPEHLNNKDIDARSLIERCRLNSLSENLKYVL